MSTHPMTFRGTTLRLIKQANAAIDRLRVHWPLTLRQIYYQLVAAGDIPNSQKQYKRLSNVLSEARHAGLVDWDAFEDRSRIRLDSAGWRDAAQFIQEESGDFLVGYRRDLLQSQRTALEVWIEKDALSRLAHEVAFRYCVPVVVAKGFTSTTFKDQCRHRILRNSAAGRHTHILYFGDLDPSGRAMLPAMLETLQDRMNLGEIVSGTHYGLTPDQVEQHQLPVSIDAIKLKDPRTPKYLEQFGNLAVELDALNPDQLKALVEDAIRSNLDLSLFERERAAQESERGRIAEVQRKVQSLMEVA